MPNVPAGARKPADRKKPTAAQRRKAEEAAGEWFPGNLNGKTVRLSHPKTWRMISQRKALAEGDFESWAKQTVHPDDLGAFVEADPNSEELGRFVADAHEFFGADQGE